MAYTKTNWEDLPSTDTPITSANLQNMEDGIEEAHNDIAEINEKITLGFASMVTDIEYQDITSEVIISSWQDDAISYGDIEAQPNNSRIKITNTTLLKVSGSISGSNNSVSTFIIVDENNNRVSPFSDSKTLITLSGYYALPLKELYTELDKTKTYYVSLATSNYNGSTFSLNNGFGKGGTTLYAEKLK